MKPWMWAALGAAALVVVVLLALLWWPPAPTVSRAVETDAPAVAAAAETDMPPAPTPEEPPPELPFPIMDTDTPQDTDLGPDITPEHVERAEFDAVMDEVIETCGLGVWSEMERNCDDWRCLALVAAPAQDDNGMDDVKAIVDCPAWKDTWGYHPDYWITGAECEDGTSINISLLGPSTLKMRRGIDQGFIEEFQVDLDAARESACARWGT